jgi:hypothetical protein
MNPIIVYPKGNPSEAHLIDADSVIIGKDRMGHCLAAVSLWDFKEGQVVILDDGAGLAFPKPCHLREYKKSAWAMGAIRPGKQRPEPFTPAHRGIFPDAAAAMLRLAAAAMPSEIRRGKVTVFGEADEDWCPWKFLAAWRWSLWQDTYLSSGKKKGAIRDRHKDMVEMGYPGTEGAFKMMLIRMGLRLHRSRKNGQ